MSIWDKTIRALPPVKDDPHATENAGIVRDWLRQLAEGSKTPEEFDAAIDRGVYVFQYTAVYGPKDEYWPVMAAQIDRRMARRGLAFCKWRGWVRRDEFDAWRFDGAAERAKLPRKDAA